MNIAIHLPMKSPGDSGSMFIDEGADAAALRVAEHDDVFYLENPDRVFQSRRHAMGAAIGLIDRHQIGDVTDNEQLAGPGIEDHLR